jgi:predicted nucleic acid-binding protein
MNVLFDTNVVLDVLMGRQPHFEAGVSLFAALDQGRLEGAICATTVTTVHYIAARTLKAKRAQALIRDLLALFSVARVDADVLARALDLKFADFEDAVAHEAARASGMTAIVTRDTKGFARAVLPVYEPRELLAVLDVVGPSQRSS